MPTLKKTYPYYLANRPVAANTDLDVRDKYSGKRVTRVAMADGVAVRKAIVAAHKARGAMAAFPPHARRDVLEHCVKRFEARQQELALVAGGLIILMGLNFLGLVRIPMLSREARFRTSGMPAGAPAAYVMGLAFAFGWTPCIGPVLGPILTLAGGRETVGEGAALLAAYSAGLGIPFIVAALFSGAFMNFAARFRVHLGRVEKVMGVLLVIAGLLFVSGGIQAASYWLLETFPTLGTLG